MVTLFGAREVSLAKWHCILDAYPYIREDYGQPSEAEYGECGLCIRYYRKECMAEDGSQCPLFPTVCCKSRGVNSDALYWRICVKLTNRDRRGLKKMIEKMVRAIEAIEA